MESNYKPEAAIFGMRLIVGAMMMGLVMFGVVALSLGPLAADDDTNLTILPLVLLAATVPAVAGYIGIPAVVYGQLRRQYSGGEISEEELPRRAMGALNTATILRAAMLEGVSLFGGVVTMLIGVQWSSIIPVLGLVGLTTLIPNQGRVDDLISSCTGRLFGT